MIELALSTGARASEVLAIKSTNLNPEDNTVFIKGLKGSMDREIPLHPELFNRLLSYSKQVEDKLFPISYNQFRRIWILYRPVKKKLHSLRHSFAMTTYKNHKDIMLVQMVLGHVSIQNSNVYVKYQYKKEEFKKLLTIS
jgi:integrase/recombinase XerC